MQVQSVIRRKTILGGAEVATYWGFLQGHLQSPSFGPMGLGRTSFGTDSQVNAFPRRVNGDTDSPKTRSEFAINILVAWMLMQLEIGLSVCYRLALPLPQEVSRSFLYSIHKCSEKIH